MNSGQVAGRQAWGVRVEAGVRRNVNHPSICEFPVYTGKRLVGQSNCILSHGRTCGAGPAAQVGGREYS